MTAIADLLADNPLILLAFLLAVGSAIGAISYKSFSLGPAAVLFLALAVSAWDERLEVPRVLGQLGLVLLAYAVGVSAGPSFFSALRTGGRAIAVVVGVLGLGAVVTKDVPPYEIWAGNPARLIRKRFDDATIAALLESRWWDFDEETLTRKAALFNDVAAFLRSEETK